MDVFALRDRVVDDYRDYVDSFLRIRDDQIDRFVHERLDRGALWPDALLQLNPSYEPAGTLDELAAGGLVLDQTVQFFRPGGSPLILYRHQREAIEIARRRESYVVTTGTGSGKSLTYLVPIADHVLRHNPGREQVRAIIVYPMNALINSQEAALKDFAKEAPHVPIRFAQYTGQVKGEDRQKILDHPPHILLTNYVMLEYMMVRPGERVFTQRNLANLEFLVFDELHTYRGRQGADVAMLIRRLRERSGNPRLICIGTSATVASEGDRSARKSAVAAVASKLFGVDVPAANVVDETLRRVVRVPAPKSPGEIKGAVEASLPAPILEEVTQHPLAAWAEETFGLEPEDGRLVRRKPISLITGTRNLHKASGLPEDLCGERLRDVLMVGNQARTPSGEPVFAFRLHQFLSGGGTVYATLEPAARRYLTLEGGTYAPDGQRLLFPLAFCRVCGQEYYLATRVSADGGLLMPRSPFLDADDFEGEPLYAALDDGTIWSEAHDAELPDSWWEPRAKTPRLKKGYQRHRPGRLDVSPDGRLASLGIVEAASGTAVWVQPKPFLLCLRCGEAYTKLQREYRKLVRLNMAGRSTATTLNSMSAVIQMREDRDLDEQGQKVLSFTDNRQDASLQAGHFNDFTQLSLVRAALYKALRTDGKLDHARLARAVVKAIALPQRDYAREPAEYGRARLRNEEAMQALLEYRLYEDLQPNWRINQPNLEQVGLLRIEYEDLDVLACDPARWRGHAILQTANPERRRDVIRAVLDHFRHALAIDVDVLDRESQAELLKRIAQNLKEPWAPGEEAARLETATLFVMPSEEVDPGEGEQSLGPRSLLGRYLRLGKTWGLDEDLSPTGGESLTRALLDALRGHYFVRLPRTEGPGQGWRLQSAALVWTLGDGSLPLPNPIRTRQMVSERLERVERQANRFFAALYREVAVRLGSVEGQAHTGQVPAHLRREREDQFKDGRLQALFCSPTMELGVDIRDLNVVHLRNIPPTPANYAQRSGRAGRGGQPALVVAFCAEGNYHDEHFFRRRERMVAGAVAPARFDLTNEELLRAHMHSIWLSATRPTLGRSMREFLELGQDGFPLSEGVANQIRLSEDRRSEVADECGRVLASFSGEVKETAWYRDDWIAQTVRAAPEVFDRALDRWRELYAAALRQRAEARAIRDDPRQPPSAKKEAGRGEEESHRQTALLLNETEDDIEGDFSPYRYLASEGFLPGYNFPRLPLRALVPVRGEVHQVDRPRFLALTEFGPGNILYHEGRKYRVSRSILPAGGVEQRLRAAVLCKTCGYFHEGDRFQADVCDHCGTTLTAENSERLTSLFEMTPVRLSRVERITCDEEERIRRGFEVGTYYRAAPGPDQEARDLATVRAADGGDLLGVTHLPQALVWQVNFRWRRTDHRGFAIDAVTGTWERHPGDDVGGQGDIEASRRHVVFPFTHDTRNILMVQPIVPVGQEAAIATSDEVLVSLGYALQRGMQFLYQVEEREVTTNLIGEGADRRILFWEEAEGGIGVFRRVMDEATAIAEVARVALEVCHFDPATGEDRKAGDDGCSRACYDCLLSYSNQFEHRQLNRHAIRNLLLALAHGTTVRVRPERTYEEQYRWLLDRLDPESGLERALINCLHLTLRRLPDAAQVRLETDVFTDADFYYKRPPGRGIAVFCDGVKHDEPKQRERDLTERGQLEDLGYTVVVIRGGRDLEEQVRGRPDVFGPGVTGH
jgi:ATP-dependent helicase YprA (DUF1998 family)